MQVVAPVAHLGVEGSDFGDDVHGGWTRERKRDATQPQRVSATIPRPDGATDDDHDLLVVGGGINGAGIARDAAGRGLSTLLVERDDLACATSRGARSSSTAGCAISSTTSSAWSPSRSPSARCCSQVAPHLIEPLAFVLPHEPHLRPAWMIRAGLFLYDRLGGRMTLPRSFGARLAGERWGAGLQAALTRGFVYADARVDDARLVVLNAQDAQSRGARIRVGTRLDARAPRRRRLARDARHRGARGGSAARGRSSMPAARG